MQVFIYKYNVHLYTCIYKSALYQIIHLNVSIIIDDT